jgi:hypothetical protein
VKQENTTNTTGPSNVAGKKKNQMMKVAEYACNISNADDFFGENNTLVKNEEDEEMHDVSDGKE